MNGKGIIKKLTLYSSMITLLFVLGSSDVKKNKDYFRLTTKITKNKIEYNSGTIYIGDEEYLETIQNLNKFDVLVLDKRNDKDPDLRIYDSYKIENSLIQEEIIESLLLYEKKYPTKWFRTKNSMIREWVAHNIMYLLGYKTHRTTDVDLNNADEITYRIRKK